MIERRFADVRWGGLRLNLLRIDKKVARKLHDEGKEIFLAPSKLMPGGVWSIGYLVQKAEDRTFDQLVNSFDYYNTSYEQGYYAAFYSVENLGEAK